MEETHMGNPNSRERKRTATCPLLNGQSYESNWLTSQLWARLGQSWSNRLCVTMFGRRFLCRNPK